MSKRTWSSILFLLFVLSVTGCSDARMAAMSAWGSRHSIKCWSGGVLIYEGTTTGKIENEAQSDGYYFKDEKTDKVVMISGNCFITVAN